MGYWELTYPPPKNMFESMIFWFSRLVGYNVRFLEGTLDLHHQVDDGIFNWSDFF